MPRITKAAAQEEPTPAIPAQATKTKNFIRDKVLKAFETSPGVTLYAADLAEQLGVKKGSVQYAVKALSSIVPGIIVVIPAQAWRYDPSAKASKGNGSSGKRMFEELTTTKAGVILVQDEDGNVYKLEEL